ncbi:TetR/AcrR family transcriptional regulator [Jiangella alkaliphila]|uniref:Regulatory protein, tetR family n=1 Tax=Jiangella alkaliphila TaxID=419479 RepID=A0A1H2KVS6_9ACTN|nr:TetR/AcrR family transcriptional regulator [Jiangella alkaliphila]SDU72564.1 regulatory protein, tetR family [Jiangella alkaliphila]
MATDPRQADPNRTLDLLWDVQAPPTRGPKPALSVRQIVDAAIAIADAEGVAAVSMRRVADDLGYTTMSLYRYVPSKTDLLDLMVEHAMHVADLPAGLTEWRDKLRWWATDTVDLYRRRRWALDVPLNSPPMGPNQIKRMEQGLAALDDTGLSGGEMLGILVVLSGYVRGHAQLATTLADVEKRTGTSQAVWDQAYGRMLTTFVNPDEHPTLARIVTQDAFDGYAEPDDEWLGDDFRFGLDLVLDGIARYVERRQDAMSPE